MWIDEKPEKYYLVVFCDINMVDDARPMANDYDYDDD